MMGMASGGSIISGTFYADSIGSYTINFGKTLSRYIVYFEMTKESKETLVSNWTSGNRSFGFLKLKWDGCDDFNSTGYWSYTARYSGTTAPTLGTGTNGSEFIAMNDDNMVISVNSFSSGTNYVYVGYTYNYMIIPIE